MSKTLRLLLVDDSEDDAELILREIRKGGYDPHWERVCTRAELGPMLDGRIWDLIICDHVLPGFSSFEALDMIRSRDLDLPVLVVSGAVPEDVVTSVMRAGAHDFISKRNLLWLLPAVERELQEALIHKERRRMARRLAESEGRYTSLFNENPAPMLLIDASTLLVVDANPAAAVFFGYSHEILKQAALSALITDFRLHTWKTAEQQHFSDRVRLANGSIRDVDVYLARIPQGARALLQATFLDQSGLKEAEYSLKRLAAAVDQVTEAIVIASHEGQVRYANNAFYLLVSWDDDESDGAFVHTLIPSQSTLEALASAAKGVPWEGPISFRTRAGEPRELYASFSPVRAGTDEDLNVVAVLRDVRTEMELERQLRQAEKMDALGSLAAGIAHDFNNVLTTILSAAELIKWNIPEDSPIRSKVDAILHAGLCASGLNRQILAFSRKSEDKCMPMDLTATVREALQMLKATLPPSIELRSDLTSGIWVEADPSQFHQVVLNLGINAFHAIGIRGGLIDVSLAEIAERDPLLPPLLQGKRCAMLRMRDTGCGMDASTLERIFEPFFTTKPAGEGTGLGLTIVHTAITQAGGLISVSSEPGKGTTFQVFMPCALGQERPPNESRPKDAGGTERLLYVEDEEIVAALAKQGLQNLGYSVSIYSSPVEALEEFRRHPDRFDLVLTDLAMPEMNGADLTGRLQEIRPGLPVLLVTGLPPTTALTLNARADFLGVVAKPFTTFDLARAIRKALSSGPIPQGITPKEDRAAMEAEETRKGDIQILLAEDSQTTRAMIRSWLEHEGYKVHAAPDGMEAWKYFNDEANAGRYDLLLTDVVMPRMDGLELTQLVRRADPYIPIAVLTSNDDQETVKSALHLGVKEYLNKPFEKADLLRCVEKLLAERVSRLYARRSLETAQAVRLAQKTMVAMPEKDLPLFSLCEPLTDAGGDIFRCMRCKDGSILFVLADVAGHSVASSYAVASFLTMLSTFINGCQSLQVLVQGGADPLSLNQCSMFSRIPCEPLRHLAMKYNQSIQSGPFSDVPVCALFGYWSPHTGRLHLLNAGIPHSVIYRKEKRLALPIQINGTPLGVLPELMVEEQVLQMMPGDRLLVGTDGFFDVLSADHKAFYNFATDLWSRLSDVSVDGALSAICESARAHGNGVIADDLLVVAFEQPTLMPQARSLSLHLPSTAEAVDKACERLEDFFCSSGIASNLSSGRCFDIVLACREALINAVSHGNHDRTSAFVDMHCHVGDSDKLIITVIDGGPGFDLNKYIYVAEPLSERGRGFKIIRHAVEDLRMTGSELSMTFLLKEPIHDDQQIPASR